jgi:tetratricopeptide (TPR) repeat protein
LSKGETIFSITRDLKPGEPFVERIAAPKKRTHLAVRVGAYNGDEIIAYEARPISQKAVPSAATEPESPEQMQSADELYITGLHLEQYRHATRCPTLYWREALRRDPLDCRCNNAMGLWHLRRGEFSTAEHHFRKAIERLTRRNANPYDCEASYNLGLCLRYQMDGQSSAGDRLFDEAYAAFYKATWDQRWAMAGFHALAEMDCRKDNWTSALEHLERALRLDTNNLRARDLKVMVLQKLERYQEADEALLGTLALDCLDWWARYLSNPQSLMAAAETVRNSQSPDLQTRLDIAHDLARAGFYSEAIVLLKVRLEHPISPGNGTKKENTLPDQNWGAKPMALYTLGWLHEKTGKPDNRFYKRAAMESPDYCFPSRLEDIAILQSAMRSNSNDARAPYYLGNLLYDRHRHAEAIKFWEKAVRLDPTFSIVWRNLGIGYFNISRKPAKARVAYDKAFTANRQDARLLFERDQLWKRLGCLPARRLAELERYPQLTGQRDDLSVELCALYNQTGQPERALEIVTQRKFQPWEGGEGLALGQHVRTHLGLGRKALGGGDYALARTHFEQALASPENLSEATHILANCSDIRYWLGTAWEGLGDSAKAREQWQIAAAFKGDFQEMSVRPFSEMTFYSALALQKLGRGTQATRLLKDLQTYAKRLAKTEAKIDYFATSLPTMLLFEDDLQFRQQTMALVLEAQARFCLGQKSRAKKLLEQVLQRDSNNVPAADLRKAPM